MFHNKRYHGVILSRYNPTLTNPFYKKSGHLNFNGNPGTEGLRIIPKINDIVKAKPVDTNKIKPSTFGTTNNAEENKVVHSSNPLTAINNTTTNNINK